MGIEIVDKKTERVIGGTNKKRVGQKANQRLKGRNKSPRDAKPFVEKMKIDSEYKSAGGMIYKGR